MKTEPKNYTYGIYNRPKTRTPKSTTFPYPFYMIYVCMLSIRLESFVAWASLFGFDDGFFLLGIFRYPVRAYRYDERDSTHTHTYTCTKSLEENGNERETNKNQFKRSLQSPSSSKTICIYLYLQFYISYTYHFVLVLLLSLLLLLVTS